MDDSGEFGVENPYEPAKKKERKNWFVEQVKTHHGERVLLAQGGTETQQLYQDLQGCFISGQFIACVILSASIVEHLLVLELGFTDYSYPEKEPTLGQAITDAHEAGIITDGLDDLRWLANTRNGYVHFRDARTDLSPTMEKFQGPGIEFYNPNTIGEDDARRAIPIVIKQQARTWEDFQKAAEQDLDMDELYQNRSG